MKTLVAGFGNIFRSDDGLGSAVLRLIAGEDLGPGVRVRDFGTGGMHLALEMLEGYDRVIIVDAIARDDPPGTAFAIEITGEETGTAVADPHDMHIGALFALYRQLREQSGMTTAPQVFVVGCVPENLDDGMEFSDAVRAALPSCVQLVRKLITNTPIATGANA